MSCKQPTVKVITQLSTLPPVRNCIGLSHNDFPRHLYITAPCSQARVSPWASSLTLHFSQLALFLTISDTIESLHWPRANTQLRPYWNTNWAIAAWCTPAAAFEYFLPCHQDVVSSQTRGRSLFSKAPTMHPVCSAPTKKNENIKVVHSGRKVRYVCQLEWGISKLHCRCFSCANRDAVWSSWTDSSKF